MSLTNRLSAYFLAAIAVILIGFSATLYFLVRWRLEAQLDERLQAVSKTLIAAVEIHPNDVQWEPLERRITDGDNSAADQPRWMLHDRAGNLRDRSFNLGDEAHFAEESRQGWRLMVIRMRAGAFAAQPLDAKESARWINALADKSRGDVGEAQLPDDRTFLSDGLTLTVAVSEGPVSAMLNGLAAALVVVSLAIWIGAALLGRWLCRRALRPISQMAASAREIRSESEPFPMLDVPSTGDELQDLGEAFNELLADLRDSLERQRRFAGDASHQLRTPLTAMLTSVDVVLRQERSEADYRRVLETVARRGGQLKRIIESLLFLARSDGSSLLGDPEAIDLNRWCESWLDGWTDHARASDFEFQASPTPSRSKTHPALLGQILDNLLDNACKYSEPGTSIFVSVESEAGYSRIVVRDRGCGVSQEQQARIFEPFYRGADARWQGKAGVGLGLAVVQKLVAILGAKIEVVSEPGKGSSFGVVLSDGQSSEPSQEPQSDEFKASVVSA